MKNRKFKGNVWAQKVRNVQKEVEFVNRWGIREKRLILAPWAGFCGVAMGIGIFSSSVYFLVNS